MSDIIRTARDGCFQLRSNSWGAFLRPCPDPTANAVLEDDALKSFELADGIAPIPAELWSRWVQLCFHFAGTVRSTSEVSCRLLRHEDDKSQWRILIPVQEVDGASVRVESFDQAIDIETGEVVASYPPPGWVPCGSSHSHNTMASFFSGTDDKYELGDPGLHIVVGSINTTTRKYTLAASITANKRRFLIDHEAVIDTTPQTISFHPDALNAVSLGAPSALGWAAMRATSQASSGKGGFTDPNAGNGYSTPRSRSGKHQHDLLDQADWGWGAGQEPLFHAEGPIETASLIRRLFSDAINDCLFDGDNEGIDWLMADLRQLLDDTTCVLSDDVSEPTDSTVTAHPTTAQGLPAGQW
ncbi:MAG: Mov34/MPN/PAD-1 family protein [Cyanobium sp. 49614_E6]|jgi:hypothetical protein|nr:Mov34/MPN/PAD-1 family protein [Cyanobium sp. 49614_E6]